MNYRRVYMRIISRAKSEMKLGLRPKTRYYSYKFPNQYFEFHHILPRCEFPNWSKRVSNIVALTAREHFFCHQLLTNIYPCRGIYYALSAFMRKSKGQQRILTARQYQVCKEAASKASKGKPAWNKGVPRTEELKEKLRKPHPSTTGDLNPSKRPEVRQKLSSGKLGKRNPNAMHWIIRDLETNELFDFYGGLSRWAKQKGFSYTGTIKKGTHPRYKLILAEKAS